MAKKNRGRNRGLLRPRDVRTAKATANVRYGPQQSALNLLLGEAKSEFKQERVAAKDAARASIKQAERARAPLAAVYSQALTQSDTAKAGIEKAFGDIGAAADPFEAATQRESGLNRQQIADAAARANKELTDRQGEAAIGRQFALGAARQRYQGRRATIDQQLGSLRSQKGEFTAATLGDLLGERAKQRFERRESARERAAKATEAEKSRQGQLDVIKAADVAKETGLTGEALKDKAEGKDGKGKFDPASRSELRMFSADYKLALKHGRDAKTHNAPRTKAENRLTSGFRTDTATLPRIDNPLALSVALDVAYDGVISQGNVKALRKMGLKPNDLSALSRKGRKRVQQRGFGGARDEMAKRY